MSFEYFLKNNTKRSIPKVFDEVFVFVASWCPHSKRACKMLLKYDPVVYAVDKEAFVNCKNFETVFGTNKLYKKYYDNYIATNDLYEWKYPHIFVKDTQWNYIGGEDSITSYIKPIKF